MKFMCRPAIVRITIFLLVRLVETSFLTLFYPPYVNNNHSLGYPWDWMSLQTGVHLSMLPFLLYLGRCLSVSLFFLPFFSFFLQTCYLPLFLWSICFSQRLPSFTSNVMSSHVVGVIFVFVATNTNFTDFPGYRFILTE